MRFIFLPGVLAALFYGCSSGPDRPSISHHFITLQGGDSLHYSITGNQGDTLLVLSGGPGWSSSYLQEPFESLSSSHVVVFLDLIGRGQSSPVADSTSVTLGRDLADFAEVQSKLRLGRFSLGGHGYGAGLAAMYALHHPDQIRRLLLLSPMFTHVNLVWQASFQANDSVATARYLVARRLGRDTIDAPGFCRSFWGFELSPVEEADSLVVRRLADEICDATPSNVKAMAVVNRGIRRSLASWDWRDTLRMVSQPTLIVQGDGNLFLKRTGQIWSELLPHARFTSLPGNSHFPWLDNSTMFTRVVDSFLSSPNVSASSQ